MQSSDLHSLTYGQSTLPIVMLHGWKSSLQALKPLGDLLARYANVHLIDLPGFGESPAPQDAWGSPEYAERVIQYLDEHKLEKVDLLGHSFGGRVSLRIAAKYPERVNNLILVGSHGLKRKRTITDEIRVRTIPRLGKLVKIIDRYFGTKIFQQKFAPRFGSRDYNEAGNLRPIMVKLANEDQTSHLYQVKANTLLLWGKLDLETPVEMGRRFNSLIKNSSLIEMDAVGHFPFEDVGAHRCAYYISNFLGYNLQYAVEPPLNLSKGVS